MSELVKTLEIGVGLVLDDARKKILLVWNDKWQGFSLPMSKIKTDRTVKESANDAAIRAVAEAIQLPVRLAQGRSAEREHCLLFSQRDGEMKGYNYHVAEIEIHPYYKTVNRDHRPVIWATFDSIADHEIGPLAWSVKPIFVKCRELEWI